MAVKKKKKGKKGAPDWLVSWGDMCTLLLTFFVIMISFAEIEGKDFFLVLSSFRGSLGMFHGGHSLSKGKLEELGQNMLNLPSTTKGSALAQSHKHAISIFKPEIRDKKVRVIEDERGLVITLTSDTYFDPGSARIRDVTRPLLEKAAKIINSVDNYVRIEGHTDNTPVAVVKSEKSYSTNWELSALRSVNILRYLEEEENVESKRLSAVGFGEHRPLVLNKTPENKAFNRRVDIVLLRDKLFQKDKRRVSDSPLPDEEWR
jgi:chemotaxis protein MotB